MSVEAATRDAVLRIGEVCAVEGRRIFVLVDKNKNLSDLFLEGHLLRNVAVNGYVELRKGFLSIIGRVEGERIEEDLTPTASRGLPVTNRSKRVLTVALSGYIDERGQFTGGTKELPLIGNEAFLVTPEKMRPVYDLGEPGKPTITIAELYGDEFEIALPVDTLFNGHIAIFGNTGSGKTNTLAALYSEFIKTMKTRNASAFRKNTRFLLLDFNGEYGANSCITEEKKVFALSTRSKDGDKIPLPEDSLLDLEVLAILTEATEKTQKPFLRRAVRLFNQVHAAQQPVQYLRKIVQDKIKDTLRMSDKIRAFLLLNYFEEIFFGLSEDAESIDLMADIEWYNGGGEFRFKNLSAYFAQNPGAIPGTIIYKQADQLSLPDSLVSRLMMLLYVQLVSDVISNRAQNDHIAPVINRLKSKKHDIDKLFDLSAPSAFWASNFVVINLHDVSLEMRKTIPLLLCKTLYSEHKHANKSGTLSIIIDEAHNILSTESFRESESWKDYRLETFEEIIKEGRKFGVFVTISSQRPSDISSTITSQAHNYFVHRLINEWDLKAIASSVSYIDRVTEESIPTLPTGTCIFSGVATQMPLKINVKQLPDQMRPKSDTRRFSDVVPLPK